VRKTLITALVAGLIAVMAPAAHAETRDLTDATGDVMTATLTDNSDDFTYHREGGAEGDIVFARIQHTATQVVMYMRYRQLSVPQQYGFFNYVLEGNNKRMAVVQIGTRHGAPQGQAFAVNQRGRRCAMSYHINYANDSVSARVGRGCLGRPKYVRLNHLSYRLRLANEDLKFYYDNPARDGGTVNQIAAAKTPWVVTG
jgi:hypothetical protein